MVASRNNLALNPNVLLFDTQSGKLTRDGFLLIQALTTAINDATSDFVLVAAIQTITNKTMDGDANTFVDIATSSLKTKTGTGGRVVTASAAGTTGRLVAWSSGDLIDALAPVYVTVGAAAAVVPAHQISVQTADRTGTNVATAQPVFDSTQDVLTLVAATTYFFEAEYQIESTGTTGNSLGVLFALAGGATLTSIAYTAQSRDTTATTLTYRSTVATVTQVTEVVAAATERTISLKGIIRVNASGTLTPQFQYSTAPGVAPTIRANSFFRLWPIGTNTVATVGAWA